MKKSMILTLGLLLTFGTVAQTTWYNPLAEDFPVIQNQGWTGEIGKSYQRIPERAKRILRKLDLPVINLAFSGNGPLEKVIRRVLHMSVGIQ